MTQHIPFFDLHPAEDRSLGTNDDEEWNNHRTFVSWVTDEEEELNNCRTFVG